MAIVGIGIDVVEVKRIARMLREHEKHFLARCFTGAEQAYCLESKRRAAEHFAARFAAKEAIVKALGTGLRGKMAWTEMEVVKDAAGKPSVRLAGECARVAAGLGIRRWHLSLSHTEKTAVAQVVAEGEQSLRAKHRRKPR